MVVVLQTESRPLCEVGTVPLVLCSVILRLTTVPMKEQCGDGEGPRSHNGQSHDTRSSHYTSYSETFIQVD